MSKQAMAQLSQLVCRLAEYYDRELTPNQIAMYVDDLMGIDPKALLEAVLTYRRDPRNTRFPLPGQLVALIHPPETDEEQARLAAGRILAAISRYGLYQLERARDFIGPLGWEVVRMQGGWESVVVESGESDIRNAQAQWRELAKAIIGQAKRGELGRAPRLPERTGLVSLSNLLTMVPRAPERTP